MLTGTDSPKLSESNMLTGQSSGDGDAHDVGSADHDGDAADFDADAED